MARLAVRDAAAFEAVLVKRWKTSPSPVIDHPNTDDVDSVASPCTAALGRRDAGAAHRPVRRGDLEPN